MTTSDNDGGDDNAGGSNSESVSSVKSSDWTAAMTEVPLSESTSTDSLVPRVRQLGNGLRVSLLRSRGRDGEGMERNDRLALLAYKALAEAELPSLRLGNHLHHVIFGKSTANLLLWAEKDVEEDETADADKNQSAAAKQTQKKTEVVVGGGTFRLLQSKNGPLVIDILALAVGSSEQGRGHGTRIVNALKALALVHAEEQEEQVISVAWTFCLRVPCFVHRTASGPQEERTQVRPAVTFNWARYASRRTAWVFHFDSGGQQSRNIAVLESAAVARWFGSGASDWSGTAVPWRGLHLREFRTTPSFVTQCCAAVALL